MKETESRKEDKIEIFAQKEINKQTKFLGAERKIAGLTLWEYNVKTKQLNPATITHLLLDTSHRNLKGHFMVSARPI